MILRPSLAIRALVFTDDEDRHICTLGERHCFFNLPHLRLRINQFNYDICREPATPVLMLVSEAAAFGEDHLRLRTHTVLNSLQNGHAVARIAAVAAEV